MQLVDDSPDFKAACKRCFRCVRASASSNSPACNSKTARLEAMIASRLAPIGGPKVDARGCVVEKDLNYSKPSTRSLSAWCLANSQS